MDGVRIMIPGFAAGHKIVGWLGNTLKRVHKRQFPWTRVLECRGLVRLRRTRIWIARTVAVVVGNCICIVIPRGFVGNRCIDVVKGSLRNS